MRAPDVRAAPVPGRVGVAAGGVRLGDTMALTTAIRRATITTRKMDESLRFYRDVLGFSIWYDQVVDDPIITRLLGVPPGVAARVCILRAEDDHDAGMIGLMEFQGQATRDMPATGSPRRWPVKSSSCSKPTA